MSVCGLLSLIRLSVFLSLVVVVVVFFTCEVYWVTRVFLPILAAWSLGIVHHVEALSGVVSVNMADDLMMCVSGAFLLDFSV